jgi:hypothetical protein
MRKPPPEPPRAPPREPFPLVRTPPSGTLLGLDDQSLAPAPAAAVAARGPVQAPPGDLERHIEGLRLELASFREWLPGQLPHVRPRPRPPSGALAAAAPPPLPGAAGRWRELRGPALAAAAVTLLAVALAFASASAALSWPAYARLVARAARLGAQAPTGTVP